MDVVMLAQHGVENAVATLGTATTPAHVQKLLRQADEVVFCFDGDAAGRRAAWHALEVSLEALADRKVVRFLFLPAEHDPDSYVRAHGARGIRAGAAGRSAALGIPARDAHRACRPRDTRRPLTADRRCEAAREAGRSAGAARPARQGAGGAARAWRRSRRRGCSRCATERSPIGGVPGAHGRRCGGHRRPVQLERGVPAPGLLRSAELAAELPVELLAGDDPGVEGPASHSDARIVGGNPLPKPFLRRSRKSYSLPSCSRSSRAPRAAASSASTSSPSFAVTLRKLQSDLNRPGKSKTCFSAANGRTRERIKLQEAFRRLPSCRSPTLREAAEPPT